jgi:hypothetical protein
MLPVTERLRDPLPVSDAVMVTLAPNVALLDAVADRLNVAVTDGDSDGELQGEALSVTDGVNVGDSDGELHGDGDSVTLAEYDGVTLTVPDTEAGGVAEPVSDGEMLMVWE